jgi:hypothetical protein
MCVECGCDINTVGSGIGNADVKVTDVSKDGESGLN